MAEEGAQRVTTLELFFDLVFVFTITQLTSSLVHELTWETLGQVACMLGLIWFMYGGYAWLTNNVATADGRTRVVLLLGMGAYLVLALAIPDAYDDTGTAFGAAYLVVILVHAGLLVTRAGAETSAAMRALAPYNLASALIVLVGGVAGGAAQVGLWVFAPSFQWFFSGPLASRRAQDPDRPLTFGLSPAHFVERHGLVIIVAIGESVVAVGLAASGLDLDLEVVVAAIAALAVSAGLWWAYFGDDDDAAAEHALASYPPAERQWKALAAFGLPHYWLLLGVVLVACGLESVVAHSKEELATPEALALAGGVAVYLVADAWFRRVLGLGRSAWRAAVGVLVLATIPLGTELSASWQLVMVGGALILMLVTESRKKKAAIA